MGFTSFPSGLFTKGVLNPLNGKLVNLTFVQ